MSTHNRDIEQLAASVFSDGTELFRAPAEPDAGEEVTVRVRMLKGFDAAVTLLLGSANAHIPMRLARSDAFFAWYETALTCADGPFFYSFLIEASGRLIHYNRLGARLADCVPAPDPHGAFQIIPGFHVPAWAKGALQYQILPDRFRKGNPSSDILDREYAYAGGMIRRAPGWDALPEADDYRCQYGGDLVGVAEKLDYLQSLGVEAIYFNPVFVSPSPHKYDTQDYDHIDPHLTLIASDGGQALPDGDSDNSRAGAYIRRTTMPENLQKSDEWFAGFCQELHRRGMKIILDGVFNHCGSFHRWMNREGIYPGDEGAFGNPHSPCRSFFDFRGEREYDCWWNIETLPKLYYQRSERLMENIMRVAEKWASPPYSIDGWRLDVAADLGQNREFNHLFWREFRRRVKAVNPDVLIIAEHYGDPSEWLRGGEWDSVMNYDAFMEPVSFFLTGMEKHSDYRRDDLYLEGGAFFGAMLEAMSRLPTPSLYCAMNELSNHDHSRFMTRTNGVAGRLQTHGSAAASEGIRPEVFREAAVIQMTWPGAPTIYYGDEAGLTGWTDPDNRRTYPWGREDRSLIGLYRALAGLRREYPVLRGGSVKPLCSGWGYIAYARFDAESLALIVCNNTQCPMELELPLRTLGVPDGTAVDERLCSADAPSGGAAGTVTDGILRYRAPSFSAAILTAAL